MQPVKAIEKIIKNSFINLLGMFIPDGGNAPVPDIKNINSALVLRPDRLGDFILAVPAINMLKDKLGKEAKLTIVAGKRGEDIARLFFNPAPRKSPLIEAGMDSTPGREHNRNFFKGGSTNNEIIVYNKNFFSFLKVAVRLMAGKYDVAINFHSYPFSITSAIMTLASKCRVRIGYKKTGAKNPLGHKIFNKGIALNNDSLHESIKDMLLLKPLKITAKGKNTMPKFDLPVESKGHARDFYKNCGITGRDFVIGMHPTLKKKDNRWKKENYRDLIIAVQRKFKAKIVVVYGIGEQDEIQAFRQLIAGIKDVFIFPHNDILRIMAAAQRFNKFVCNDSGIMHAVSLVTDVIAIFGPSTAKRWSPIGPNKITILQKKDGDCDSVSISEVLSKISG